MRSGQRNEIENSEIRAEQGNWTVLDQKKAQKRRKEDRLTGDIDR
jgi:hypothetical protein